MNALLQLARRRADLIAVLVIGLCCFVIGASVVDEPGMGLPWSPQFEAPLPHQIPKTPGSVSLRFAMVHDVIHERYAKHGRAYYEARNLKVRQALKAQKAAGGPPSQAYFDLLDDLGVGLDSLGEDDEAIQVMRAKLQEQKAHNLAGRELYTTYANLGTFLIHGHFARAQGGAPEAVKQVREGLAFIHKAIEVNPEAHFGREKWQAVAVEFFLSAIESPDLLLHYDIFGNSLASKYDSFMDRSAWSGEESLPKRIAAARSFAAALNELHSPQGTKVLRDTYITRIGAEYRGNEAVHTSLTEPVPFDEPVLGVIGMWRQGGGASPHFCLFLGEAMMRVRQRQLAWAAYERAKQLADHFWPNPALREKFIEHCKKRQS
jgi:hypothetical protein